MMNIKNLINNDLSNLSREEQIYINKFNENLRKELINELVLDVKNKIFNSLKKDKEEFNEIINEIIINGYKGLKNISTQGLLDLYLEKNNEIDFINLMEKIERDNA